MRPGRSGENDREQPPEAIPIGLLEGWLDPEPALAVSRVEKPVEVVVVPELEDRLERGAPPVVAVRGEDVLVPAHEEPLPGAEEERREQRGDRERRPEGEAVRAARLQGGYRARPFCSTKACIAAASSIFGSISSARAKSSAAPATSPFACRVTPRFLNDLAELGSISIEWS